MRKKIIVELEIDTNADESYIDALIRSMFSKNESGYKNSYVLPEVVQIDIYQIENES